MVEELESILEGNMVDITPASLCNPDSLGLLKAQWQDCHQQVGQREHPCIPDFGGNTYLYGMSNWQNHRRK